MNVLHVTPALAAAVMAGESTLLPLDGMACPRCGGEGIVEFRDEDNHVYADECCPACNGLGVVPPDVSGRCGVAADGLLVGTVEVVEVLPVVDEDPADGNCLFVDADGDLHLFHDGAVAHVSNLLPLLGDPESLVGRWVALVANPVPTIEGCPNPACHAGVVWHTDPEGERIGWSDCGFCDRPDLSVPVPAASAGTVTTWEGQPSPKEDR